MATAVPMNYAPGSFSPYQTPRQLSPEQVAAQEYAQRQPMRPPVPAQQPQALSANTQPYKAEPMPATKPLNAPAPAQKQPIQPPQRSAPQKYGSSRRGPVMNQAQRSSAYSRALGRTQ